MIDSYFQRRLPGKNGGFVDIHVNMDVNKRNEHIQASQVLANKGNQIQLMPEVHIKDTANRQYFFAELPATNASNPDARFNGILGDFKVPDNNPVESNSIKNGIRRTNAKGISICCFSLLNKQYRMQEVLSQIRGSLKNENDNKSIREIWILTREENLIKIGRGIINHKDFYKIVQWM